MAMLEKNYTTESLRNYQNIIIRVLKVPLSFPSSLLEFPTCTLPSACSHVALPLTSCLHFSKSKRKEKEKVTVSIGFISLLFSYHSWHFNLFIMPGFPSLFRKLHIHDSIFVKTCTLDK